MWYMGKRTSVYLSDELDAAVKASGLPLATLLRRGLGLPPEPQAATIAGIKIVTDERMPPGVAALVSPGGDGELKVQAVITNIAPGPERQRRAAPVADPSPKPRAAGKFPCCPHCPAACGGGHGTPCRKCWQT